MAASLVLSVSLISCTENQRAKSYGGTMKVELPADTKLVSATWKDQELWYLHRPMRKDEAAETSVLVENSSFGLVEGQVKFIETKSK